MTDLFLSSNGYGNDYLKSGLRWSEQPGPPQRVLMNRTIFELVFDS